MSIWGNPVMMGGSGGGGSGNYIQPVYAGLSYGYNTLNGWYYESTGNDSYASYYELDANKTYMFSLGWKTSNRLRALFFSGKSFDNDFKRYVENAASGANPIYQADDNITGSAEITGADMIKRYYFTTDTSGMLVVVTSNQAAEAPIYLGEIPSPTVVPFELTKGSYSRYNGTLTLVDPSAKEYSFIFTGIRGTAGFSEFASIDTGDTSGATKTVTFTIDGNWKDHLTYGNRELYCYGSDSAVYSTGGIAFSTAGTYRYTFTGRYLCWSFGNVDDDVVIDCSITGLIVTRLG